MILTSAFSGNRNFAVPPNSGYRGTVVPKRPPARRFATRREIYAFLVSRDFRKVRDGWSNGNWFATIQRAENVFLLALKLDSRPHLD
jgi:hypothetical protein